jgi:ribosomal protein S18 acetylase RimI-like enzyme
MRWNEIITESEVPWVDNATNTLSVGSTTLEFDLYRNDVQIKDLDTPVADRGQGQARKAMLMLAAKADQVGAKISLLSYPQDEVTKQGQLNKFYRSLGYKAIRKYPDGDVLMVRQPKTPKGA